VSQSSKITQSSSSSSSSQTSSGGNGIKTFSGTGGTNLSFSVDPRSRLVWTNDEGERFSAQGEGISIDSRRGRGEVRLDAGRYEDVKVRGKTWTIIIRPR
jgi:hypothetical protein